jgi:glycosyltransferase involved in cell wall biosynthesis
MRRPLIITESCVWGGLEAHAVNLAETLSSAGFDPTIACIGEDTYSLYRRATGPSVRLALIKRPTGTSSRNPYSWRQALGSVSADAAILEKGTLNTGSLALDIAIRMTFGAYIAIEQLEPPIIPPRSSRRYFGGLVPGVGLWWYRWKLRGYSRSLCPAMTVCVSDAVRDRLATDYGFSRTKLATGRHGVDLDRFHPDPIRRDTTRASWGIPRESFVFGSVRRFVFDKGLDVAVDAFAAAVAQCPGSSLHLVLVGDGPERGALERQAERCGVAHLVKFPGFTNTAWDVYPAFDVFLLPSRVEALGVVALEAMACDCEVIGSDVGGIPEMISDPSLGTLVPAGDSAQWATAMVRAIRRAPTERSALVQRARMHVTENFERRAQYLKIASLLANVSGKGRGGNRQCA